MRRREFIAGLGSAAVSWPLAARAQQGDRIRRIGVLENRAADDPQLQAELGAFQQGLQEFGWAIGRNVRIDFRTGAIDTERIRESAAELIALAPDVILAIGGSTVGPLQQATRTLPIVFALVPDPVAAGFVARLARPGGNITGFTNLEYGVSGKWPELLKQIAPRVTRLAILRDPTNPSGTGQLGAIQAVASSLGAEPSPIDVRSASEIERGIAEFAGGSNGGLIVLTSGTAQIHRELIITLAARHRLPAIYPYRFFVAAGGLISYGPDDIDQFRRAAGYVDRILKGEKPADLPVQAPVKFETVLNLKTAKALGLTVPETLLATADEVIQ
jgi:putative tryptophan/tyrosine transport system substrate-binding protein